MQDESCARCWVDSDQVDCQDGLEVWVGELGKRHVKKADSAWGSLSFRDEMRYSIQPQRDSLSM